jgi:toxin ParE1/3/4
VEYNIVWSEPARSHLQGAVRYVAERNSSAAQRIGKAIVQHVEILRLFPFIGPVYERDETGQTREILCKNYRIFYQVNETARRVEILAVWHSSRDEPDLPL